MRQSRSLWATVSASLVAIGLFPIYTVFFLAPDFEKLLVENTKKEAVQLASYFSTFVVEKDEDLKTDTLPTKLLDRLRSLQGGEHLIRMRIFSPSGEIIYSTEPTEVGHSNQEAYFKQVAASGTARAEIIPKHSKSLENEIVPADVVETYVPITRGGRLLGVFELYHNVSRERQELNRLIYRSYGTLFIMAAGLLVLVLFSSAQAHRSMKERARVEEQLRLLSFRDDLTGLYNRRGFLALGEQQVHVANRDKKPMMVVSADLDGLKEINDTFGHQEGDRALLNLSAQLQETFRDSDVVARMGGDEFVVLSVAGPEDDSGSMTLRLRERLDEYNRQGSQPYQLQVSIGLAGSDAKAPDAIEQLLAASDRVLYEEKRRKAAP